MNEHTNILNIFINEYENWCRTGTEPVSAAQDVRYFLDCQEKRLKAKSLSMTRSFTISADAVGGTFVSDVPPYKASVPYTETKMITDYRYGKKTVHREDPLILYASVLDKQGSEDRLVNCPSCGHPAMVSELQDGCPYCRTIFKLSDLYPKVTSWYTVPQIVERTTLTSGIRKVMIITASVSGTAVFLLSFLTNADGFPLVLRILYSLFVGAFGALGISFAVYMTLSMALLIKALYEGGRALPLLGGISTRKKMTVYMKTYDPAFSYELFEGKVTSLVRAVLFSNQRDDLSIYTGSEDLSRFDDLVDMAYRGAVKVMRFTEDSGILQVTLQLFLTNTYMRRHLTRKDEKLTVILERDASVKEDPGFTVHAVKCRGCGASFDAMHERYCPNCGRTYDAMYDDWVITSVRM